MSGIYIPGERIPDTLTAFWIFPDGYVRVFGKNGDEIRGREAIPVPDHKGPLVDALEVINTFPEDFVFTNEQAKALTNFIIPAEEGQ